VFDAGGGPNFEKLADATAAGGILIVYGRFSPEMTPLPLAQTLWKDLTIRGFGLPSTIAGNDKLTAVKNLLCQAALSEMHRTIAPRSPRDTPYRRRHVVHDILGQHGQ
jgi:NADPH:quinone reductase-like Zn-dependent oxidoreductase